MRNAILRFLPTDTNGIFEASRGGQVFQICRVRTVTRRANWWLLKVDGERFQTYTNFRQAEESANNIVCNSR